VIEIREKISIYLSTKYCTCPLIFKTKLTTERQEKRFIEAKIDQELRGTENLQHAQTVV